MLRSIARLLAFAVQGLLLPAAFAQGLEGLVVEEYHRWQHNGEQLVTYRIYADLAKDHTLQMVYGSLGHALRIETSTTFFNDTVNGAAYAHRIPADAAKRFPTALDSWLTIDAVSNAQRGVPLAADEDGSLLRDKAFRKSLLKQTDGAIPGPVRDVVNFKLEPGYLDRIPGSTILCTDCAWSVLGGTTGATEANVVLLAQITTSGTLSYEFNLQVGKPGGTFIRYVAAKPEGDEVEFPALRRLPERLAR